MSTLATTPPCPSRAATRRSACTVTLFLAILATLAMIAPSHAHQPPPATAPMPGVAVSEDPIGAASPATTPRVPASPGVDRDLSTIVLLLALIPLVGVMRRRRPIAFVLTLVALALTFETGVHSVHHFGSPSEAAHCAVAAATTHSPGVVGETGAELRAPARGRGDVVNAAGETRTLRVHRAFRGRAPPDPALAWL